MVSSAKAINVNIVVRKLYQQQLPQRWQHQHQYQTPQQQPQVQQHQHQRQTPQTFTSKPTPHPPLPAIQADVQRESDEARAAEKRARSDMEHEALLRLEANERAAAAERAEQGARKARASAELLAESLRVLVWVA